MRYLSDEWIAAADVALKAAAVSAPAERIVIDQYVEGAANYRVVVAESACSVEALSDAKHGDEEANAAFHQTLATAQAVAQGETDAHQAFLLGQITFTGDIDVLIERREAFDWLQGALEPVMSQTIFTD